MAFLLGKEILLIEDAPEIRTTARKILEAEGAVVREAQSVEEGMQQASLVQPHLILLDLQFATESGFAFLSARKVHSEWREIPTIVLSGTRDRTAVVKAYELGATDYIVKPFRTGVLLQKVGKALSLSGLPKVEFPAGARPSARICLSAGVSRLSEVGFRLDSSVKFDPDQVIRVECDLLRSLGAGEALIKTSTRPAQYSGPSRYEQAALFTGVGEEFTKELRRKLKRSV
jgi:CheY-like chemotaxis protein